MQQEDEDRFNEPLDRFRRPHKDKLGSNLFFYIALALVIFFSIAHFTDNMHWIEAYAGPITLFIGASIMYWTIQEYKKGYISVYGGNTKFKIKRTNTPVLFFFFFALFIFSAALLVFCGGAYWLGYIPAP
ncbi:MAG: hypothetical protein VX740_00745 [Pseudomonadota bacterium]|nr:hypothetical protein [Pseudomonadota bacterium]MED5421944.1 hypothetical protein [Pseudomonadota bacterium]MEE3322353.1 hypothetical protein [Pseudomonadota bacterium]